MLEAAGLAKRYGRVEALRECSFRAERGRILGLLGPNGAGKTTAIRCIFGLVVPDRGELRWDNGPLDTDKRARFGYMPEERGLYPAMRVAEQLTYFGRLHGMSRDEAGAAARHWLARLGLADREESRLEELSHGNQQRVQLATALLHQPDLVVLDEPFAGMDPVAVQTLQQVVRDEADRGAAVIFSSHQLDLVEDLCQDIAILSEGTVVLAGALDELRRRSQARYLELSVPHTDGASMPAIADAEVVSRQNGTVRLRVPRGTRLSHVLGQFEAAGPVEYVRFEPPRLNELFLEAVRGEQG